MVGSAAPPNNYCTLADEITWHYLIVPRDSKNLFRRNNRRGYLYVKCIFGNLDDLASWSVRRDQFPLSKIGF